MIELERLVKKRYFRLHVDNSPEYQKEILTLCQEIAEEDWGIENNYEAVLICSDGFIQVDPKEIFNTEKVVTVARHHQTHAAAAFYLSPFKQALIVSYDGGGDDGHFNVYAANQGEIKLLKNIKSDFGGGYLLCGSMIREVAEKSRHQLALSGNLMGLCGYGNIDHKLLKLDYNTPKNQHPNVVEQNGEWNGLSIMLCPCKMYINGDGQNTLFD